MTTGHVDEILSFVQLTEGDKVIDKVLVASPRRGVDVWEAGAGDYPVIAGFTIEVLYGEIWHQSLEHIPDNIQEMTVSEYNNHLWDTYIDTEDKPIKDLPAKFGLPPSSLIEIPVVFFPDPENGRARTAPYPNRVNLLAIGPGRFLIGDCPVGDDPAKDVITNELGNNVVFVESQWYYMGNGDVHCGTNVARQRLPRNTE